MAHSRKSISAEDLDIIMVKTKNVDKLNLNIGRINAKKRIN